MLNFRTRAFTLIEMLVVIAVVSLLAAMILPVIHRAKSRTHRIKCLNNLRQLSIAAISYADDNERRFPPRRDYSKNWIVTLRPYYHSREILHCPGDRLPSGLSHSYLINGWNDYFETVLGNAEFVAYTEREVEIGISESAILEPTETILFGEKITGSGEVHMDFIQNNDFGAIEHARHAGSSNFAFVDGSVRALVKGTSLKPINLWAITLPRRLAGIEPE